MKTTSLMLLPLIFCSCQTPRQVTLPNGATYSDGGHFAGDTTVLMEPDGSVILRNKMNKPWADFLQAAAFVFGVDRAADVAIAQIAKNRATRLAAQRAATQRAADAADLARFRETLDFERFRLLLPTQLPAGPP
jgi:hypothetical protein